MLTRLNTNQKQIREGKYLEAYWGGEIPGERKGFVLLSASYSPLQSSFGPSWQLVPPLSRLNFVSNIIIFLYIPSRTAKQILGRNMFVLVIRFFPPLLLFIYPTLCTFSMIICKTWFNNISNIVCQVCRRHTMRIPQCTMNMSVWYEVWSLGGFWFNYHLSERM